MVGGGLPLGRAEKEGCIITSKDVTQRQFESCRDEQEDKRTISRFFATRVDLGGAVEEGGTTDALTLAPAADAVVVPTLADPNVPRPTVPRAVGELPPLAPVVLPATLALAASRSSRSLMAAACLAWDEAVCRTAVDEDGRVDDGWEGATDDLSLAEDRVCWAGGGGGAGAMVGCRVWGLQERAGVASTGWTRLEQKPPKKSSASDSKYLRPLARRSALPSEDLNLVPQHPTRTPNSAAMAQKQASRQSQAISLKGSTKIVAEFFDFSVVRRPSPSRPAPALLPVLIAACLLLVDVGGQNNILYQRGIYPTEDFKMVKKCVCCPLPSREPLLPARSQLNPVLTLASHILVLLANTLFRNASPDVLTGTDCLC